MLAGNGNRQRSEPQNLRNHMPAAAALEFQPSENSRDHGGTEAAPGS